MILEEVKLLMSERSFQSRPFDLQSLLSWCPENDPATKRRILEEALGRDLGWSPVEFLLAKLILVQSA